MAKRWPWGPARRRVWSSGSSRDRWAVALGASLDARGLNDSVSSVRCLIAMALASGTMPREVAHAGEGGLRRGAGPVKWMVGSEVPLTPRDVTVLRCPRARWLSRGAEHDGLGGLGSCASAMMRWCIGAYRQGLLLVGVKGGWSRGPQNSPMERSPLVRRGLTCAPFTKWTGPAPPF